MKAAFSRAILIANMIAVANGDSSKLALIPTYTSRGHGKGKYSGRKQGNYPSGKYLPHQGEKECARRVCQLDHARVNALCRLTKLSQALGDY